MVRYTVVWSNDVQRDFIERWVAATSNERRLLTAAANLVDESPGQRGAAIPSEPDLRIWSLPGFTPSVAVTFEVLVNDRIVRIMRLSVRP